jgi:hypothetical protein
MALAIEKTYQGKPTLELKWKEDSPYPFNFGVGKAKLILASIPAIQAFVDRHKDDPKPERTERTDTREGAPSENRQPAYEERKPTYDR